MCQQAFPNPSDPNAAILNEIAELLHTVQRYDISPVHLPDIVRDFLYDKYLLSIQ